MVDGIIISLCSYKKNRDDYLRLQQSELPMVFYDRIPYGLDVPQVVVDDWRKSFFLVEKLILGGRKRIVHISGPDDIYNSAERARGYRDAIAKYKMLFDEESMVIKAGMSFDAGAKAIDSLISKGTGFDAVFAFTDTLAIGAMNRLRELGRNIPEDAVFVRQAFLFGRGEPGGHVGRFGTGNKAQCGRWRARLVCLQPGR